jgi:hypothetical protein
MHAAATTRMLDPERNLPFRRRWSEQALATQPVGPNTPTDIALEATPQELLEAWRKSRHWPEGGR